MKNKRLSAGTTIEKGSIRTAAVVLGRQVPGYTYRQSMNRLEHASLVLTRAVPLGMGHSFATHILQGIPQVIIRTIVERISTYVRLNQNIMATSIPIISTTTTHST